MDEREAIFRKVVVDRLSSPDQLDQLLQVLRPRSWMLLLAIGLLFATASAWSVSGTVVITAPASGLLLRPGGVNDLSAPRPGRVVTIQEAGARLQAGETAATVRDGETLRNPAATDGELAVTVPFPARIVEVLARPGQEVAAGEALLSFEASEEELRAVLFVETDVALETRPGMTVWISPRGEQGRPGHHLSGEVLEVAPHPATARGLQSLLADRELTDELVQQDRRWRVDVRLPPPPAEAGGAVLPRISRTEVAARIVLRQEAPIHQLLPWLRRDGG